MWIKRTVDIAVSLALLLALTPVILGAALLIRLQLGAPVLFKQERPGKHMKPFQIYKFRTMTDGRDFEGNLLRDEERLTTLGAFLRRFSIDELPQLLNVIKGDMSLVGPRPLLMRYLPYFSAEEQKRFLVRPGITGLAQISGRNELPWNQRLALDVSYVERCSIRMDAAIFLKTVKKVLVKEGFQEAGELSRPRDLDAERKIESEGNRWLALNDGK
ncbi:MAG: sugar transferase [Paenibacillus sp.]|jgi:sugar transferase EpsL|nr:sugar transferase [Paenibacillus sp.]